MTLRLLLSTCWLCGLTSLAQACTTFCLVDGQAVVYGRNYDFYSPDGWVMVNRRGLAKTAFLTGSGAQWISRYGSLTLGQFGYEFPCGGMNEAGLVIELMALDSTQYQARGTVPTVLDLQWIQYQLDCSASVAEVLASDDRVRLDPASSPLHFLIADRSGHRAVIEFLHGVRVIHTEDTLPVAALTNDTYDASLAYAASTPVGSADHTSSLGRFVHAADAVRSFAQTPAADPIAYAFTTLDAVAQPSFTRWSVVYDLPGGVVLFRTPSARAIKRIRLAALDFRPASTPAVMDVNTAAGGDVVPDQPYTTGVNLALMNRVFPQLPGWSSAPALYVQQRATYPESTRPIAVPTIVESPISQTIAVGGKALLTVVAAGESVLTYQWYKDGSPIAGATDPSLMVSPANAGSSGDYIAAVTNPAGTASSRFARVLAANPEEGRLCNLSVRQVLGADGEPLIVGFTLRGGSKPVLVRAIGPTLRTFDVADTLENPRLEVHDRTATEDRIVATNDDWSALPIEWERIASVVTRVGAFPLAAGSRDAAVVIDADGGRTVHVRSVPESASGVVLFEAYDAGEGNSARLVNLSVRSPVRTGSPLIAGFVINGNVPKRLLIRGVGPGLRPFGVPVVMADPRLELHSDINGTDRVIAVNDSWSEETGIADAAAKVGAFPLDAGSTDAALSVTLPAGAYTVLLCGADRGTGTGLMEVYECD